MALGLQELARGQKRPHLLGRQRLAVHRAEPAQAHQLGDAAGVGAIGFDRHGFEGRADMARLKQFHRQPGRLQASKEPLRQRPGLQADARHGWVLSGLAPPPWPKPPRLSIGPSLTEGRTRMRCLECGSEAVTERPERTAQGYRRFRCRTCGKQFNERSGTLLNRAQYPSEVIALVVLWRLRYKRSLRDLPEMFAVRGIVFSHEAV